MVKFRELVRVGIAVQGCRVFGNAEELRQLNLPEGVIPAIDWENEIVVGIFAGIKPTGGYQVAVDRVEVDDTTVKIHFEVKKPSADTLVTQAFSYPGQLVALARKQMPPGRLAFSFCDVTGCLGSITHSIS